MVLSIMSTRWIALTITTITVFATVLALYTQLSNSIYIDHINLMEIEKTRSMHENEMLQAELEKLLDDRLASAPKSIELAAIDQRFNELDKKISNVYEKTQGLRLAINPMKPDEMLTIARLTDKLSALEKDLEDLESVLEKQQKVFQDSILREIKSSNDSTTLILVVLIPLVLNFLYTVWKDMKSPNNVD